MGAGLEVGAGFQQAGSVKAQVCIDLTCQPLQSLLGAALPVTLQPGRAQASSSKLQGAQLALHAAAKRIDQQGADVAGPAQDRRAPSAPQGPGPDQLLQKQRR